tara:strand:- start:86 stop:517 length:432 start_codon:yes stop_codon:yes gene_type:complete
MSKTNKWVGLGIAIVIALLAGRAAVEIVGNNLGWNDDEETRVHKTLEKAAEFLNKDLPKQLDKNTTLVNVRVSPTENKSIFQFVITNNEAFDENRQRQYQQNSFCTDPGFQPFRRDNVVMEYRYKSVDGNFISSIEVGNSGCE